ncbi:MAG TPA: hypothetical protein VJ300_00145 [Thermoplasmata archaeon]|nr:hypothetical protein [Thermoplasmata archaeon]
MALFDDLFGDLFGFLGLPGTLLALFLVFAVDAALFPLLPELAIILSFSFRPPELDAFVWGLLLLGIAMAGEGVGNTALYGFVRRVLIRGGHMPAWLERSMKRWIEFLVLKDERIILLNRVAPVVPMVGAFIAACRWDFRRSLAYILIGAGAKYSVLLALSGFIGIAYDPLLARWVTVGLVLAVVGVSLAASLLYRRRAGVPPRPPA